MKLYNLDHSPFATRVRMQIHKKNLDIVIAAPPAALGTPQFLDHFPMGKIPVLELDDGTTLPDSWVIMEYLEEVMPAPSLRPAGAVARAHMQLLARYADTYLAPAALTPLFGRVAAPGGTENAGELLEALDKELARLQRVLQALPDFRQRELHLGDIALAPHMDYVLMLAPMFGVQNPLADHSLVAAWWEWVSGDPAVARGSEEMRTAVQAFFGG